MFMFDCVRVCGVVSVCFAAVRCDRLGSSPWHPPLLSVPSLWQVAPFQPNPPAKLLADTKAPWLCPVGLPVTAGIDNGSREI